jgi:hypothetical protein
MKHGHYENKSQLVRCVCISYGTDHVFRKKIREMGLYGPLGEGGIWKSSDYGVIFVYLHAEN